MIEMLLICLLVLVAAVVAFQVALLRRPVFTPPDFSELNSKLEIVLQSIQQLDRSTRDEFSRLRQEFAGQQQAFKLEIASSLNAGRSATSEQIQQFRLSIDQRLDSFGKETNQKIELLRQGVADSGGLLQTQVGQEMERLRTGLGQTAQQSREEMAVGLKTVSDSQKAQMDEIRTTVETRLNAMNSDNERRLEQMRQTVEEKLQGTLEARLGESFKQVSERLEQVHKGLGEMQTLAAGVGDLKRVLTNVKTRGTWGEVQLGNLLEQVLTVDQFEKNVATTGTQERVEFAIKLPGREDGETCWLPIDAKFPIEDYHRIAEAAEGGDPAAVEEACRALERTLRLCAKNISEKYLSPPLTTDFAILFLPTEGLYAEALRRTGLVEALQRDHRVILTGPNTFAAILNSLQMGFKTLVIQRQSSEVWKTLGAVKTQFAKYGAVLAKVKKKLLEASNTVDVAETRTRVLQRTLLMVDAMPDDASQLLVAPLELAPEESESLRESL